MVPRKVRRVKYTTLLGPVSRRSQISISFVSTDRILRFVSHETCKATLYIMDYRTMGVIVPQPRTTIYDHPQPTTTIPANRQPPKSTDKHTRPCDFLYVLTYWLGTVLRIRIQLGYEHGDQVGRTWVFGGNSTLMNVDKKRKPLGVAHFVTNLTRYPTTIYEHSNILSFCRCTNPDNVVRLK